MLTALYYPNTTISPGLVKNALFLWDRIEYIAPWDGFMPDYQDRELGEAVHAFSTPLVPTEAEKQQVDKIVADLIESGLPDWFHVEKVPENLRYGIYPDKLLERTRESLRRRKLAQGRRIELKCRPHWPCQLCPFWLIAAQAHRSGSSQMRLALIQLSTAIC